MKRIFVVEDDPTLLTGLEMSLAMDGYEIFTESDGEQAYQRALIEKFDLLILDLSLPTKNGLYICRDLRTAGIVTPIMILTSRSEEMDKVIGLDYGADDYMTKPFSILELQARVKALLRRVVPSDQDSSQSHPSNSSHASHVAATTDDTYCFGDLTLHYKRQEGERDGATIVFSTKEFQILRYFISHEREVVTRDMLLNDVWGYESFPTTRTVDNYLLSLRKKIEPDPSAPRHLLTVHHAGYKFIKDPA